MRPLAKNWKFDSYNTAYWLLVMLHSLKVIDHNELYDMLYVVDEIRGYRYELRGTKDIS